MPVLIAILLATSLGGCVASAGVTRFEYRIPPPDEVVTEDEEPAGRDRPREARRRAER